MGWLLARNSKIWTLLGGSSKLIATVGGLECWAPHGQVAWALGRQAGLDRAQIVCLGCVGCLLGAVRASSPRGLCSAPLPAASS
ncbi:Uncharacterized protein TCM_017486 [Theobroma cacao]|uniref:Uncharacterized protein n=1 Tax=Theobroma cacao TaxID=3641 RepID=A0A061EF84_THECC|nr:Uncharacterized protein TCM_017486 [Theobroma cacao]